MKKTQAVICLLVISVLAVPGYVTEVDLSEQYIISCADGIGWSAHEYQCDVPARDGLTGAVYESDCPYVGYGIPCDRSSEGYPYPYPRPCVLDSWAYIGSGEPLPPVYRSDQRE